MLRFQNIMSLACMLSIATVETKSFAADLGETSNFAELALLEGNYDPAARPFPVTYVFSEYRFYTSNPNESIKESIFTADRNANVTVYPGGIIKLSAYSSGSTGDYYVHGASSIGGFRDTFSIASPDDWVDVTFRLWVDGVTDSSGPGPSTYNRGQVQGFFNVTTAPGGQRDGNVTWFFDHELYPATVVEPCVVTGIAEKCGYGRSIARNSYSSYDGSEFFYTATVKANEDFTLEVGLLAGAYSLAAGEWATSDFDSTAIFGGIEVAPGLAVTSRSTGGVLETSNASPIMEPLLPH